ncbi:MAG: hypothetical protein V8R28_18045 [Bacteroides cellulosilyticus]
MNIETDIVHCDKVSDFSEYKMLIIPPLYIATDELLEMKERGAGILVVRLS